MTAPLTEILYFEGCPNHKPALDLVEHVSAELGIDPEIQLVEVADAATAQRLRFLGSPTIRVNGRDIDPHTHERNDYALSCRVFQTDDGPSGQPDPRWLRVALLGRALWASERVLDLTDPERALHRWILQRFARGAPPSTDETAKAAETFGLDFVAARIVLERNDLVHFGDDDTPTIAYPFSAAPRGHAVLIDERTAVEAMCAIDALGVAPMLGLPTRVQSHDPQTGTPIEVRLEPSAAASWNPPNAVVLVGRRGSGRNSFDSCCTELNFFEDKASALRYLDGHPGTTGAIVAVDEAVAIGRDTFGDLLHEQSGTASALRQ